MPGVTTLKTVPLLVVESVSNVSTSAASSTGAAVTGVVSAGGGGGSVAASSVWSGEIFADCSATPSVQVVYGVILNLCYYRSELVDSVPPRRLVAPG